MNHFILYAAWSAGVLSLGPLASACAAAGNFVKADGAILNEQRGRELCMYVQAIVSRHVLGHLLSEKVNCALNTAEIFSLQLH